MQGCSRGFGGDQHCRSLLPPLILMFRLRRTYSLRLSALLSISSPFPEDFPAPSLSDAAVFSPPFPLKIFYDVKPE